MPVVALALTVVLWASAFAAIREAVAALGWQHLSFLRLAAAALALGCVAALSGGRTPARRDLPLLALVATSMLGQALAHVRWPRAARRAST